MLYNTFLVSLIFSVIIIIIIDIYNNIIIVNDNTINYNQKILSCSPKILYLHNFITEEESKHCISYIDHYSEISTVLHNNKNIVLDNVRSSKSVYMNNDNEHIINIENKVMKYASTNRLNIEKIQGVLYDKDQQYLQHYDFFDENAIEIKESGNRVKTIIIYLNDVCKDAGGGTYFPYIDLRIHPKKLDALYFENINNGKLDYNTLHTGEKIIGNNKKYILNIWIREK